MADLVTLDEAKTQLYIPLTDARQNDAIGLVITRASAIVVDYVGGELAPTWTPADAPAHVKQAALFAVGHLWEHRGDDLEPDAAFWSALARLLARTRDPVWS